MAVLDREGLEQSHLSDLHAIASELGIEGYRRLRREALIDRILAGRDGAEDAPAPARSRRGRGGRGGRARASEPEPGRAREKAEPEAARTRDEGEPEADAAKDEREPEPEPAAEEVRAGVLDVLPNGSGFMRAHPFAHSPDDVYVSPAQIRRCELRIGDRIEGPVREPRRSERHPSVVRIDQVNGRAAEEPAERPRFDALMPVFASERLPAPPVVEAAPFGRGSRVAIGGPPGAGASHLLRAILAGLEDGAGEERPTVVLVGVRPEELAEWRAQEALTVGGGSFDESIDDQAHAAQFAVESAKRVVERGGHAVVAIDSLDALPAGVARRVFGAARATAEGGSLTIFASTGSAGEPLRQATTRIVLEPWDAGAEAPRLSPASGTLRRELLKSG